MSKASAFRQLLASPHLDILMGAYDGLSARIAERAGFRAIWASGLSISAALGLRDYNEASWTQVVEVLEFMADATSIPILVDGDSGYGNFNSVRRLVKKLGKRGLAAVCIEDSQFPKKNSFSPGTHELVSPEEFCGKLRAAKDSQLDLDFCVIARTEALVAGRSMDETLERAAMYREAGADAILVQSKDESAVEVLRFSELWHHRSPLVIVPTSYYRTPVSEFEQAGISLLIWANQGLRAAITALTRVCVEVRRTSTVVSVEPTITTMAELFDLLEYEELHDAEDHYVRSRGFQAAKSVTR
jgi:phosphoenolpyruvate mutase